MEATYSSVEASAPAQLVPPALPQRQANPGLRVPKVVSGALTKLCLTRNPAAARTHNLVSEYGDIYRNISIGANIDGFEVYCCIGVVLWVEIRKKYCWCCVGGPKLLRYILYSFCWPILESLYTKLL